MKIYENKKEVFISKECLKREVLDAGRVLNNRPSYKKWRKELRHVLTTMPVTSTGKNLFTENRIQKMQEDLLEQVVYRDAIIRSLTSVLSGVLIYAQNELDSLYSIEQKDGDDCGSEEAEFAIRRAKDMLALIKGR